MQFHPAFKNRLHTISTANTRAVVAMCAVVWLATLVVLPGLTDRLSMGGWIPADAEAVTVDHLLADQFDRRATSHFVLLSPVTNDATLDSTASRRELARITHEIRSLAGVTAVYTPLSAPTAAIRESLVADDGESWLAVVQVDGDLPTTIARLPDLNTAIASEHLTATVTGVPALSAEFGDQVKTDLLRAELIALPIALLCLIWFAGGLRPALAIVLTAVTALALTLLVIAVASHFITISIFALSTVAMLTIALSLDFGLLYALRNHERHGESQTRTTVMIASFAVLAGMAGLMLLPADAARSIGIFGFVGVTTVLVCQRYLLPALMWLLRSVGQRAEQPPATPSRWLAAVGKHPVIGLCFGVAILIPLIAPVTRLNVAGPDATALPARNPAVSTLQTVETRFSNVPNSPIYIVARPVDGSMLDAPNLFSLKQTSDRLASLSGVQSVNTVWSLVPRGISSPMLTASLALDPALVEQARPLLTDFGAVIEVNPVRDGTSGPKLVELIRQQDARLSDGDLRLLVGGADAASIDLVSSTEQFALPAAAVIALATIVALMGAFRSVLLPIKAVLLNMLPVLAGLGVVTWVFQLGTPWTSSADSTVILIPLILAWLMFGISMDYEVFMLARIRENRDSGMDNATATVRGIEQARTVVSRGAVLMGIVFLAFATSDIVVVRAIGIGLLVAIIVDATIVRLVLLPASMILLGRWNWWWPQRRPGASQVKPAFASERVSPGDRP